jgi:hypothetical protein
LNSHSLCSTLTVRDPVSHPYITDKIIVLYILIFIILDRNQEDKDSGRMTAVIPIVKSALNLFMNTTATYV